MAMGWDDALMLLLAATQTASALNPPENNMQTPAPTSQPPQMGQSPLQPTTQQVPTPGVPPLDTNPMMNLASELAKSGPPPASATTQPTPIPTTSGKSVVGPPSPSEDPVAQAAKNEAAWKGLLAAAPQAIALVAPLLGLGQDGGQRQYAAPPAGGPGGQTVMQMPGRRPNIGEILSSLRI